MTSEDAMTELRSQEGGGADCAMRGGRREAGGESRCPETWGVSTARGRAAGQGGAARGEKPWRKVMADQARQGFVGHRVIRGVWSCPQSRCFMPGAKTLDSLFKNMMGFREENKFRRGVWCWETIEGLL